MNLPQLANRKCGRCTVCCSCFLIEELSKPQWVDCRHLCDSRCGIYADRPKVCKEFECHWLRGAFTEDDRPERLGVVFYMEISPPNELNTPFLIGLEVAAGAMNNPRVRHLATAETKRWLVVLKHLDGRIELNGPPELKKKADALLLQLAKRPDLLGRVSLKSSGTA